MFSIGESNVKITKQKVISDKLTVGTLYTTYKKGEEYIKTFIECKIVGNALLNFKALGIKDKEKFTVLEGVVKNEPYLKDGMDKSKVVITIFELCKFKEK